MIANNGRQPIPKHQIGILQCNVCEEDGVFRVVNAVQFCFDKLAPHKMQAVPATLYQCIKCNGFLLPQKDGSFKVGAIEKPVEGDEWKLT